MSNPLGSPLSQRPTEGYSKSIQVSDPQNLDSSGQPIVTEVGDAINQAVRAQDPTPVDFLPPETIGKDSVDYKGRVISSPVPGERGEGFMAFDRQVRGLLEIMADRLNKLWFLMLYQAQGGLGTGQTALEFLSAQGMELNPLDMGEVPASEGQLQPLADR